MWLERLSTITAHRVTGMAVMASRRTARDSNAPRFQLSPFDSTGSGLLPGSVAPLSGYCANGVTVSRSVLQIATSMRSALMQPLRGSLADQNCRSVNETIEMLDAESIRIDQNFY